MTSFKLFVLILTAIMQMMPLTITIDFYYHWDAMRNISECMPTNATWEKERQAEFGSCIAEILHVDINNSNFSSAVYSMAEKAKVREVLVCAFTKRGVVVNGTFNLTKNNEFFDHVNFTDPDVKDLLIKERENCYNENKDDIEELVVCTFSVTIGICGLPILNQVNMNQSKNDSSSERTDGTDAFTSTTTAG